MTRYPVPESSATVCARRHAVSVAPVPGTDLCGPCRNLLTRALTDLVHQLAAVEGAQVRQPVRDYSSDRVSGGSPGDVTALWNTAATDAGSDIRDYAQYLARTLRRDFPGEAGVSESTDPRVILAACARYHSRWLSGYPELGPLFLDDALELLESGRRAVDQTPVKRIRLPDWICEAVVGETPLGPLECGATMIAVSRPTPTDPEGWEAAQIRCSVDPHHPRYPAKAWLNAIQGEPS